MPGGDGTGPTGAGPGTGRGCLVWTKNECIKSESSKTPVSDRVGAGDLFGAAFSYGYIEDWDLQYVSDFANAFAGLSMQRTERKYPDANTIKDFINKRAKHSKE